MANKNKDSIEGNKDGKIFFWGIMVSIVGSMMVTSLFEFGNHTFSNSSKDILEFYTIIFVASSIAFWQISKTALKEIGVKKGLRMFDVATVIFAVIGLIGLVHALTGYL
jgi:hypothetical protein